MPRFIETTGCDLGRRSVSRGHPQFHACPQFTYEYHPTSHAARSSASAVQPEEHAPRPHFALWTLHSGPFNLKPMSAILPHTSIDSDTKLARYFMPHQLHWIQGEEPDPAILI